jgi:hypothetical protein
MANVKIAGNAVVITSEVSYSDLETVAKYRPDGLVLKGGENGKEEIFRVELGDATKVSFSKFGAKFCPTVMGDKTYATITLIVPKFEGKPEEYVADVFGAGLINLKKVEERIPEILAEVSAEKANILSSISVAQ